MVKIKPNIVVNLAPINFSKYPLGKSEIYSTKTSVGT